MKADFHKTLLGKLGASGSTHKRIAREDFAKIVKDALAVEHTAMSINDYEKAIKYTALDWLAGPQDDVIEYAKTLVPDVAPTPPPSVPKEALEQVGGTMETAGEGVQTPNDPNAPINKDA